MNAELLNETTRLQRFAYKLTQNRADADDLFQSTILRAIEKKTLFKAGSNLFSWASRIMYNMFVSGYRRKVKFETQYDPESYIEKESVRATQELEMELQEVGQAIQRLSGTHRQIIIMVCVKELSYEEVSEALNVPVGTVRSRLSRARKSLQEKLEAPSAAHSSIKSVA